MSIEVRLNPNPNWFEDDAFWEASYPIMFPATRFSEALEEVQQVRTLSGLAAGAVLDLACGPGRHSVPLAKQGFKVTGLDRSAFLLDRAMRYAREEGVQVEWLQSDMREFQSPGSYDLAISMYTSFGYFDSSEENQKVLENIHTSLRPGGTFVINVLGKEPLARKFIGTDMQELEGVGTVVQHRRVRDDWTHLDSELVIIQGSTAQRFGFRVWIYSGSELRQMLEAVGFDDIRLFGHLDGTPYDVNAHRLVAVARRAP